MGSEERVFCFGSYELDEARMCVTRDGRAVEVETKPFLLLRHLVRNAGRVVGRDELMREVWLGVRVTEGSVKTAVHTLRRTLEGTGSPCDLIRTIRGRGYMVCGPVSVRAPAASEPPRAPVTPDREPRASAAHSDFVGRESELDELRTALDCARNGRRQVVVVHGPSGIGKSRLALELLDSAERAGFDVGIGRTRVHRGAPQLWPWRQILRALASRREPGLLAPADLAHAHELLRLVPELSEHFAVVAGEGDALDGDPRFRQLDAVLQLLAAAARVRPLCVVLDDLEAADTATLEMLELICRDLHDARLLVVATYCTDPSGGHEGTARLVRRMGIEPGTRALALAGLSRADVQRALARILERPPSERQLDEVERASRGNPLFVLELGRLLRESSGAVTPGGSTVGVPARIRDAVLRRIESRSEPCVEVLRCASALVGEIALPMLGRIVALEPSALIDAVDEAERASLIERRPGNARFGFVHGLVRQVIYAAQPHSERLRLHARITELLEQGAVASLDGNVYELAHHASRAVPLLDADRALAHVQAAAEAARAEYAFANEVAFYEDALALLDFVDPPRPELRCLILLRLGWARCSACETHRAVSRTLSEAAVLARKIGRFDLAAHAAVAGAQYARVTGHTSWINASHEAAETRRHHIECLQPLLLEAGVRDTPSLRGRVQLGLAAMTNEAGQVECAAERVRELLADVDPERDPELYAQASLEQYSLSIDVAAPDRRRLLERAVHASRSCKRHDLECFALVDLAQLALVSGDGAALALAMKRIEALYEATRQPGVLASASSCRALRAQLDGDFERADRHVERAVRLAVTRNHSGAWSAGLWAVYAWWKIRTTGDPSVLVPTTRGLYEADPRVTWNRLTLAHLYAETGDRAAALALEVDALEMLDRLPRDPSWLAAASVCAELTVDVRDLEQGAELFARLRPLAEQGVVFGWITVCTGALSRPLASLAAMLGRWDDALELFDHAAGFSECLRSPLLRAWVEIDRARALSSHPDARVRARARERGLERAQSARRLELAGVLSRLPA